MDNTKKLTNEELVEIKTIQDSFEQKVYKFGQLYLQKIQAESALKYIADEEVKLKDEWNSVQKAENDLVDKLLAKYGQGSLDIKQGIFIPDSPRG